MTFSFRYLESDQYGSPSRARAEFSAAIQTWRAEEARLTAAGQRLTPVRRRTLQILLETHRALGAYDVLERLAAEGQDAAILAAVPPDASVPAAARREAASAALRLGRWAAAADLAATRPSRAIPHSELERRRRTYARPALSAAEIRAQARTSWGLDRGEVAS